MPAQIRYAGYLALAAAASFAYSLIAYSQVPSAGSRAAIDRNTQALSAPLASKSSEKPADKLDARQSYYICVGQTDSPLVQKIEKALRDPLPPAGLDYVDTPLNVVVKDLQKQFAIPIMLDKAALETAGLREDEPVTVEVRDVSVKSALAVLLRNLNLTYVVDNEMLIVTTPEEAERHLCLCLFDVRDLVKRGLSLDVLVETLKESTSYIDGSICTEGRSYFSLRAIPPGTLIAAVDQPTRDVLRDLLAAIRELNREPAGGAVDRAPTSGVPDKAPKATK
jgi:hypothetical protein